jgi:hypothetical protein
MRHDRRGSGRRAQVLDRPGASVHALQQPFLGEQLEVAVDGDRRDVELAGQVGHRRTAVAADAFDDHRATEGGRHRRVLCWCSESIKT